MNITKGYPLPGFWAKVAMVGNACECWDWKSYLSADGYGQVSLNRRSFLAHRVAYSLVIGEIPRGLQIDHLCRNRRCVNPWHLEPVTSGENTRRGLTGETVRARARAKTHCKAGHPYVPENIYTHPATGRRKCLICMKEHNAAFYARMTPEARLARNKRYRERQGTKPDAIAVRGTRGEPGGEDGTK